MEILIGIIIVVAGATGFLLWRASRPRREKEPERGWSGRGGGGAADEREGPEEAK